MGNHGDNQVKNCSHWSQSSHHILPSDKHLVLSTVGKGLGLVNGIKNCDLLALSQLLQKWFLVQSSDMLLEVVKNRSIIVQL